MLKDILLQLRRAALLPILGLMTLGPAPRADTIHGQVFIVTQGGENVKLGLVTVALFPEKLVEGYILRRSEEASIGRDASDSTLAAVRDSLTKAMALYDDAMKMVAIKQAGQLSLNERYDEVERLRSAAAAEEWRRSQFDTARFYFEGLPKPLATAVTDADGVFTLSIPRTGKYVLAAHGERNAFGSMERYHWLVRVPDDARKGTKLLLSNSTLTNTGSPSSMVFTRE